MLVEKEGCIFDEKRLKLSHGYDQLDKIGKEAFVNHIHLDEELRESIAKEIIDGWSSEMKIKWPGKVFRIYKHVDEDEDEVIIRFHLVREGEPNWCDSGLKIIEIKT